MKNKGLILLSFLLLLTTACTESDPAPSASAPISAAPAEYAGGETGFNNNCKGCHGPGASGTDRGPSFLSKIYEPSHHGDSAFQRAVKQGVRKHHWNFGNMPKISGVSPEEVKDITGYVRWLQREAGIS